MIKIELIYDFDCPNVETARGNIKQVLADLSIDDTWQEWERTDTLSPPYVLQYGSPTILINGRPIGKTVGSEESNSCSIYRDKQGNISRVPSIEQIRDAILEISQKNKKLSFVGVFSSGASSILALIPFVSCPLCWPAYTSFLAVLGFGFFNFTPYLLPLLFGFVILSCFLLWRDYGSHKQVIPFILAATGGVLIFIGKIAFSSNYLLYLGVVCLLASSILNIYFIKKKSKSLSQPCEGCCNKKEEKNE